MKSQAWDPLEYKSKSVFEDHTEERIITWVLMISNSFPSCEGEGVGNISRTRTESASNRYVLGLAGCFFGLKEIGYEPGNYGQ